MQISLSGLLYSSRCSARSPYLCCLYCWWSQRARTPLIIVVFTSAPSCSARSEMRSVSISVFSSNPMDAILFLDNHEDCTRKIWRFIQYLNRYCIDINLKLLCFKQYQLNLINRLQIISYSIYESLTLLMFGICKESLNEIK